MMTMHKLGVFQIGPLAAIAALLVAPGALAQADPAAPPAEEQPPAEGEQPAEGEAPPAEGEAKPEEPQQPPPAQPPPATEPAAPAEQPAAPPPATAPAGAAPAPAPAPAPGSAQAGMSWNPQADTGTQPGQGDTAGKPKKLPWRGTSLGWDHSATTETVGIGRDQQSDNPTYEMSFVLQPRYYLWESSDGPEQSISLRARLDLIREFTNSDTTTREGEWTFSDLALFPQYSRNLYKDGSDVSTDFAARLPILTLPTSKVSANNGTNLGLGVMVIGSQKVPVLGSDASALNTFTLTGRLGYNYTFTDATTPTNDELGRVRMGPDGRALPGDQLSGAAFAQHKTSIDLIGALEVTDRITWTNWFSWRPSWKYSFEESQTVEIATGTTTVEASNDPNNFGVVTLFSSEVSVKVIDELEVALGYANLTLQTGPDGTRRNMFYSPDARVYGTLIAYLDEIYKTATNYDDEQAKAPARRQVAKAKK